MPNKRLRYAGKTYENEPWGGARNVDTPPTSAESSPVNKKLRGTEDTQEIVHRRFTDTMDGDTDMPEASAAKSTSAGTQTSGGHQHNHETKILNMRPQYGLPQVATVTLPFSMYFSAVTNDTNNAMPVAFTFKTTSLADLFPFSLSAPSPGNAMAYGLYNRVANSGTTWPSTNRAFPTTTNTGTITNERPQFLTW